MQSPKKNCGFRHLEDVLRTQSKWGRGREREKDRAAFNMLCSKKECGFRHLEGVLRTNLESIDREAALTSL